MVKALWTHLKTSVFRCEPYKNAYFVACKARNCKGTDKNNRFLEVPLLKIYLPFICFVFFISGCNNDGMGLFTSSDLDERFSERNNFVFLSNSDRNTSFGEEYSFIVLSDTHIEDGSTWNFENLKNVIEESNNEVKFVVITGDITQYGDKEDLEKFIKIARSFGIPCYPVIGNHDIYFGNWSVWKELIGSTCYRVNGDGTTLFILDSANAFFGKEQIDWLQRELSSAHGRVFVFTHSNLLAKKGMQHIYDTNERARIISLLKNKCDIMFMGHSHERLIFKAGNVIFLNIEDYTNARSYCLVSVKKTGITYTFKKL